MAAEPELVLDADSFPTLTAFVQGYLHQDYQVEHGSLREAVRAWRHDAGEAAAHRLLDEWREFLTATRGRSVAIRAELLVEAIGGAWAPQSAAEIRALTRAVVATARRRD